MRRFLNAYKGSNEKAQITMPSLPSDLSFSKMNELTKRAYLAKKLGQYLGLTNDEGNTLFYHSLSLAPSFIPNNENQTELIISLSESMLKWHKENEDILKKIDGLDLKSKFQNAMLKAYDMCKQELFTTSNQTQDQVVAFTEKENSEWEVYRDVIFAATQEKFLLISENEISKYKVGNIFCEGSIVERTDIPLCRDKAKVSLEQQGFNKMKSMSWLLVLSEAITNTVKHAEEGKMTLIADESRNEIRFVIEDRGPGFPLKELPKTTMLAGYSTKKSMGQGFTLMMKMAKQVLLYTSSKGSTIILIFESNKEMEGSGHATG